MIIQLLSLTVMLVLGHDKMLDLFDMKVTLVEDFENGPVCLHVDATYTGKEPIRVTKFFDHDNTIYTNHLHLNDVSSWTKKVKPKDDEIIIEYARPTTEVNVEPKQRFTADLFLHHHYTRIPSGTFEVAITLKISTPLGLVSAERKVVGIIRAATTQRIAAQRAKMEEEFRDKALKDERKYYLIKCLIDANHKEMVQMSLSLLQQRFGERLGYLQDLRQYVYEWAKKSEEIRPQFLHFLARYGTSQDAFLFQQMFKDRWQLTEDELYLLGESPHLPIRVYTCELVSKLEPGRRLPPSCGKAQLLSELEKLQNQLHDIPKP